MKRCFFMRASVTGRGVQPDSSPVVSHATSWAK
jgi:hypothetical protein